MASSGTGFPLRCTSGWSSWLDSDTDFCSIQQFLSYLQEGLRSFTLNQVSQSPVTSWLAFTCLVVGFYKFGAQARIIKRLKGLVLRSSSAHPEKPITFDEKEQTQEPNPPFTPLTLPPGSWPSSHRHVHQPSMVVPPPTLLSSSHSVESRGVLPPEPPGMHTAVVEAGVPNAGGWHVTATVEQVPRPTEEGATRQNSPTTPSRSSLWGISPDDALRHWTPILLFGLRAFASVRKLPGGARAIFCGPNCDVWICEMQSSVLSSIQPRIVVVKVLRHFVPGEPDPVKVLERMNARWNQEVMTWAGLNHPNIVPLIGAISFPLYALVVPWYSHGNLGDYLRLHPEADRLNLISDVARGLNYLHSRTPPIVHADIKPQNILVNDQGQALLTDFGMATILNEDRWYTASHRYGGTEQWIAPEVLLGESDRRSRTGDVYSFGSLICYITTDQTPHDSQLSFQIIQTYRDGKDPIDQWHLHPRLQGHCGDIIAGIIRRCWSRIPKERPLMSTIVHNLSNLTGNRVPCSLTTKLN